MTIKLKLILAIVGTLLLLLGSNLATQYLIKQTNQTLSILIDENGLKVQYLNQLKNISDEREITLLNLVLLSEDDEGYEEKLATFDQELKKNADKFAGVLNKIDSMPRKPKEEEIFQALRDNLAGARASFGSFMTAVNEGFVDEAKIIMAEEFRPKYKVFTELVNQLRNYEFEQNEIVTARLNKVLDEGALYLWLGLLFSVIAFGLAGTWMVRSLLTPLNAMHDTMVKIAETGELNHRVKEYGRDELTETARKINVLLESINLATSGVNHVLKDMALGKFESRVTGELKGDFLRMKTDVNTSVEQISSVMDILDSTANNFRAGVLEVQKDQSVQLEGKFAEVLFKLDRSAIHMKENLASIAETLHGLAGGNFHVRSETDARGDFIPLKESLNITLTDLDRFVEEVAQVQASISEGNLTLRVSGNYSGKMAELKSSLNDSITNTASMVAKVGGITRSVVLGVEEMDRGNNDISSRIKQQAAALEDTSASMEEMTSSVRHNADNAVQANQKTMQAQLQLTSGLETMAQALESVSSMSEASHKINDIISIIDSIAFQTNLLALNAAVEAARAGEHGRGFAVVAGEVRNLAGKSADAAGEIKALIENSVKVSEQSSRYVQGTSDALTEISASMTEVSEMVSDISKATSEQAQGIELVNNSVMSMDDMTHKNAAVIEQAEAAGKELLDNAASLQAQVDLFRVDTSAQSRMIKNNES